MTADQILAPIRPFLRLSGLALALIALVKLFGVHIGVPGSIADDALVSLALLHV